MSQRSRRGADPGRSMAFVTAVRIENGFPRGKCGHRCRAPCGCFRSGVRWSRRSCRCHARWRRWGRAGSRWRRGGGRRRCPEAAHIGNQSLQFRSTQSERDHARGFHRGSGFFQNGCQFRRRILRGSMSERWTRSADAGHSVASAAAMRIVNGLSRGGGRNWCSPSWRFRWSAQRADGGGVTAGTAFVAAAVAGAAFAGADGADPAAGGAAAAVARVPPRLVT